MSLRDFLIEKRDKIGEKILSFARKIDSSQRYKNIKNTVRSILNDSDNPYKKYFDITIIFLIISSVAILIYEVKNPIPKWVEYFDLYIVSFVFLIEYILRLWTSSDFFGDLIKEYDEALVAGRPFNVWKSISKGIKRKFSYMVTPAAIIDLMAIFPAYRPLRVLRIFILFRLLKLLRYTRSISQFVDVLANKRFELLTLLFLLLFVVFTGGVAIYVQEESQNPNIHSIFDALYWSLVTISTVGYGDISPVTDMGRMIATIIILLGIAMISFATSVIVSAFSEKLNELKEERVIEEVNKSDEFLIICGYGQMTKMFFRQSKIKRHKYIILDKDPKRVAEAQHDGYDAIVDDASRYTTLSKFDTKEAKVTVLCMSHDDVENIYITLNAKSIDPRIRVISRASSPAVVKKYERAGADHILLPNEMASKMMSVAILHPVMYRAIHEIFTGGKVAMLDEIIVHEHTTLKDKRVGDIDFRRYRLVLIGVQREKDDEFIFNPDNDLILRLGDTLLIMGHKMSISYFKEKNCEGKIQQ